MKKKPKNIFLTFFSNQANKIVLNVFNCVTKNGIRLNQLGFK